MHPTHLLASLSNIIFESENEPSREAKRCFARLPESEKARVRDFKYTWTNMVKSTDIYIYIYIHTVYIYIIMVNNVYINNY
jgi:hypothetical protein